MKLNRTIDQWKNCNPVAMANEMSPNAIMFAFEDAKADIIMLHEEIIKLKACIASSNNEQLC